MGPITLFDKSFLQSLSLDESVFFDHFFLPVICPIFYVETLADLKKQVRTGRTPEQEVGIIADKVPEMSGWPCAYHLDLAVHALLGADVPMDGRIPTSGGRPVKVDGKTGFAHREPREAEAFNRWQRREFISVEREFARTWREALNSVDLVTIAAGMRALGITAQSCKSLEDARKLVDNLTTNPGRTVPDQIKLAMVAFELPSQYESLVLERWREVGSPSFTQFAPYSAYVLGVELFFQIALGADLIGTKRVSNRTDIAYFFYTPFCNVFVSSDNLHKRCAASFLRPDQTFVWGPELKADLNRLMKYYAGRPDDEKELGLARLAPTPPPDDKGLTVQLWDRYLIQDWRSKLVGRDKVNNTEEDKKLVEHINRVTDAPAIPAEEVDFEPKEAQFVQLTRNISRKKGSWWQIPKDLKTQPPNHARADVIPTGRLSVELIDALIDLTNNPNVSNIEAVMGSYEVDEDGNKLIDGQLSIALRSFIVRGMNKSVQEQLRQQVEAEPLAYIMILWMERFAEENKLGVLTFDPETKQKPGMAGFDKVQKSTISDYLQRLAKG